MIETLDNRFSERDYLVELGAPEFTSVCPRASSTRAAA
jgi:NADPH-dependent 7-cyano-7-deazaguanine reductase QueF